MGDVVLYSPTGKSLRFSHEDFQRLGKLGHFWWEIYFSQRYNTIIGYIQFGVSHTSKIEEEEKKFNGHNAHIHDLFGATQIFASTKKIIPKEDKRLHIPTVLLLQFMRWEWDLLMEHIEKFPPPLSFHLHSKLKAHKEKKV